MKTHTPSVAVQAALSITISLVTILSLSCRGPEGPQGPPGSGEEGLVDPAIQPKVISMDPPMNSTGPYYFQGNNNQIDVRFNKIMDHTSLKHAVHFFSPGSGTRVDTGSIRVFDEFLSFYGQDSAQPYYYYFRWQVGRTYTVFIDSTAKDINGNVLYPPFSATITPEPYFRVSHVFPKDGSENADINSLLGITFNSQVDASILSAIAITPAVIGGVWTIDYDSMGLSLQHFTSLAFNTTYTISLAAGAHDRNGHSLTGEFRSTFSTTSFRIAYTSPVNGTTNWFPSYPISIGFTSAIDTASARLAFSITPSTGGHIVIYKGQPYLYYTPSPEFVPGTSYTVSISTALRAEDGTNLSQPYSFSFSTAPFKVTSTYPLYDGAAGVPRNLTYVQFGFNTAIDTGSVRTSFGHPGMDGTLTYYYGASYFYFYPQTPLAANTTYTMTILTSMRTIGGTHLQTPYSLSFTTGN